MSVFSDSPAKDYAKSNNIKYDTADFNLKSLIFIVICVVILVIVIALAVRIMKKSKPQNTETEKPDDSQDKNYRSILDDDNPEK